MYRKLLNEKLKEKGILVVSHQGFSGGNVVLNTYKAMINAIKNGADIVEMDIAKTKDGVYYIFHEDFEPRHLKVNKKIRQLSSHELNDLCLYNNAISKSNSKVSTLDDMFYGLKSRDVLINLDRCDQLDAEDELLKELDKFNIEDQLILKGACTKSFLDKIDHHPNRYMFMPVLFSRDDLELAMTYEDINIVGFEFIFDTTTHGLLDQDLINSLKSQGYFLWVNALNLGEAYCLSAGIDDDTSIFDNPDAGWGRLMDMGFNVIQTDWPNMLRDYISHKQRIPAGTK